MQKLLAFVTRLDMHDSPEIVRFFERHTMPLPNDSPSNLIAGILPILIYLPLRINPNRTTVDYRNAAVLDKTFVDHKERAPDHIVMRLLR